MKEEFDIKNIIKEFDFKSNELNYLSKDIILSNKEIEVLDRYNIDYKSCISLKEIIYEIERIIDELGTEDEELELISQSISERDYYKNTNK